MFLEYADWPDALRAVALNRPFAQIDLDYDRNDNRLEVVAPNFGDLDLPPVLFAKLGPKSWRDGPGAICPAGALPARLASPTPQQLVLIERISRADAPLWLTLSAARDFSTITECRLQIGRGTMAVRSRCIRGRDIDQRALADFAAHIALALDRPVIADIAILPKGELALVDLNPLGDTAQTARDLRYSLVRQTRA